MASMIIDQLARFGPTNCEQLSYTQAADYTRDLAKKHYENFTVVSWLLPRAIRDDFRQVYSFCRWADDLGDETGDRERSIELLSWWRDELDLCYAGKPRHPVFVALTPTIEMHDLPKKPFNDLIDAFVQDQQLVRYESWDQVLDYCTRSADPVGRLVLYLFGHRDPQLQKLSDATCTALQLTNFWQDIRRDILERDRVYIPQQIARKHGLDISQLVHSINQKAQSTDITAILPAYQATVSELVRKTWPLFADGRGLWPLVEPRFRTDLKLFTRGGEAILHMIEKRNYDTLSSRPKLGKAGKFRLLVQTIAGGFFDRGAIRQPSTTSDNSNLSHADNGHGESGCG